jgi:hypothetical protein
MAKPTSKATLIDYCLRNLGAPVIEVNVDDDQIDDRIDEALQFYQEYHSDAVERVYLKHQVTQDDIDNGYITLTDHIQNIMRVFPLNDAQTSSSMFSAKYQMHMNDLFNLNYGGALLDYSMRMMHLSLMGDVVNDGVKHIEWNRHRNTLRIDMDWSNEVSIGDFIVIECDRVVDPDTYVDVYNDYYLKKYATALIKRQWGVNLKKFEGMVMPGGVTFNGQQMFDEATEELKELQEEARLNWELPVDFFSG